MKKVSALDGTLKYSLVLLGVIAFRMLPRPPDVEPVMTGMIPFGRRMGAVAAAVFSVLAIIVYDAAIGQLGPWTPFTAIAYGIVGFAAGYWLSGKKTVGLTELAAVSITGTLFYDAVTALAFGQMFGYPLSVTIAGQVSFTLLHLASNLFGAVIVSPLLLKYVVDNPDISVAGFENAFEQVALALRSLALH